MSHPNIFLNTYIAFLIVSLSNCASTHFASPFIKVTISNIGARCFGEFEVVYFGDKTILEDLIEFWPLCDCLIAFYSSGYPLKNAEAYASLRKPFLVNELEPQYPLHDRRKVYEVLLFVMAEV
ncbi:hypothetical protein MTR67_041574 [Solanum verrucosum]|uniref:VIP1 N-terminal domain-containing protein n=1 Tax=Solanum verrucosum TaxID=315347 RepID=A0AAF0ULP9_SOLVR|nr:hypothetical protein MTR67_041574 [Solanum verrucosum]